MQGRTDPEPTGTPLIALRGAGLSIAERILFETVDLQVRRGERICLVGRNGSGKTTLMRCLTGQVDLDRGTRFVQPGTKVAYLEQNPVFPDWTAHEIVASAVDAGYSEDPVDHAAEAILGKLDLDGARRVNTLSGGESRRLGIAQALVSNPDVLLLDEPTNHLDLPRIEWLEDTLDRFRGGLLIISHDRAFLRRLSRQTLWIDRGQVRRDNRGIDAFEAWSEKLLADEEAAAHRMDRRVIAETKWLREGLTARRKRNMGRVRALGDLRTTQSDRIKPGATAKITTGAAERGGQLVLESRGLDMRFEPDGPTIVDDFSALIKRGERIGIIGPNGAGKTTLIRLLLGEETPDKGHVRTGFGIKTVYFDQKRESLDPEKSLWATLCPAGGDSIMVHDKPRHVVSYLRDFLFADRQAQAKVSTLSGGERNRLLLAKLFAQPHNLLILDEPTNDLDIETLDLLQEVLADYDGTILLVSHDRDFLDRVVTSILALEGDGKITPYAGGYSDYLVQKRLSEPKNAVPERETSRKKSTTSRDARPTAKLGYKDQRELDGLPKNIEKLETRNAELNQQLTDPDLFTRDRARYDKLAAELVNAEAGLAAVEDRWLELEALRESLAEVRER